MAPEMIEHMTSSTKLEMWALGVILYQFFSNEHPFVAATHYLLQKLIMEGNPAPLPSTVSAFIKEIIAQLLEKKPETRPDA